MFDLAGDVNQMNLVVDKVHNFEDCLLINPSWIMSIYCYSIFRLDPYRGCYHSCIYCYTRYMPNYAPDVKVLVNYPRLFEKFLLKMDGVELPPFRLSALTDPFQPAEEVYKLSYRLLRLCLKYRRHVIISTKSDLLARSPWIDVVKDLADSSLTIVQFTVTLLDDDKASVIEPNAPPPSLRLKAARLLADERIPVIFRLQPLIPFVNSDDEYLEEYVEEARSSGVRQIICEPYRFHRWCELAAFRRLIDDYRFKRFASRSFWERLGRSSHKVPRTSWRLDRYKLLSELCSRNGLEFSLCREYIPGLNTAVNCCGMHFMKNVVLRKTIREALGSNPRWAKVLEYKDLEALPKGRFRSKLIEHYKLLDEYLKSLNVNNGSE